MSNKYRFGQFVGIVIGIIAGHMIIRSIFPGQNNQYYQNQLPPNQQNQGIPYPSQNNQGVFEQALSKWMILDKKYKFEN